MRAISVAARSAGGCFEQGLFLGGRERATGGERVDEGFHRRGVDGGPVGGETPREV